MGCLSAPIIILWSSGRPFLGIFPSFFLLLFLHEIFLPGVPSRPFPSLPAFHLPAFLHQAFFFIATMPPILPSHPLRHKNTTTENHNHTWRLAWPALWLWLRLNSKNLSAGRVVSCQDLLGAGIESTQYCLHRQKGTQTVLYPPRPLNLLGSSSSTTNDLRVGVVDQTLELARRVCLLGFFSDLTMFRFSFRPLICAGDSSLPFLFFSYVLPECLHLWLRLTAGGSLIQ